MSKHGCKSTKTWVWIMWGIEEERYNESFLLNWAKWILELTILKIWVEKKILCMKTNSENPTNVGAKSFYFMIFFWLFLLAHSNMYNKGWHAYSRTRLTSAQSQASILKRHITTQWINNVHSHHPTIQLIKQEPRCYLWI